MSRVYYCVGLKIFKFNASPLTRKNGDGACKDTHVCFCMHRKRLRPELHCIIVSEAGRQVEKLLAKCGFISILHLIYHISKTSLFLEGISYVLRPFLFCLLFNMHIECFLCVRQRIKRNTRCTGTTGTLNLQNTAPL